MRSLFTSFAALIVSALVLVSSTSRAGFDSSYGQNGGWNPGQASQGQVPEGQRAIVEAQERGQGLSFVEVRDVVIVRVLPDDNQGSRHQKWIVQLANGRTVLAVYNMDICDRIPLVVGSTVSMGGQYIWDRNGGLIHWLHEDPRHNRPDGYVDLNGARYGKVTHPDR